MTAARQNLGTEQQRLVEHYNALRAQNLSLDLTRGKPGPDQLDFSEALDGILQENYRLEDGTDLRNYGGLDGIPGAKRLGALLLDVPADNVLVDGNSSLSLMYHFLLQAQLFGLDGPESAWSKQGVAKFICPVPGYDRHFTVCESLGIQMIPVPMTDTGPDMDQVEALVASDPAVRGLWCVPKYANPTGCVYSDDTVERIAKLGLNADPQFRVMYDNAYAVHDLTETGPQLANIWDACERHGTQDSVVQFASTSKMTLAGAGLSFFAASPANLTALKRLLAVMTIGPDKVNQQRHVLFLPDRNAVDTLMARHRAVIKPKFDCVLKKLQDGLGNRSLGRWTEPQGGYFISFYTLPGLATEVVKLAADAGVKLTPAGAAFPYGKDPDDSHIRLAPTFPSIAELEQAMEVFVTWRAFSQRPAER